MTEAQTLISHIALIGKVSRLRRMLSGSCSMLRFARACGVVAAIVLLPQVSRAQGDTAAQPEHCTLRGHTYSCNLLVFRRVLHQARTVAVETNERDLIAHRQMAELAGSLGKTVVPGNQADLILSLAPADSSGVFVGPGDLDLAILRVYARGAEGGRGDLLWAETYRGTGDRPWPSIVHALIQQFKARLSGQ